MRNHPDLFAKKRKRFPELAKSLEEHYQNVLLSVQPQWITPWTSREKLYKEHFNFILYHSYFLKTAECCALHDPYRAKEHERIIRENWGD